MGDLHAFSILLLPHLNRFSSPHHLRSYKENYIEVTEGHEDVSFVISSTPLSLRPSVTSM